MLASRSNSISVCSDDNSSCAPDYLAQTMHAGGRLNLKRHTSSVGSLKNEDISGNQECSVILQSVVRESENSQRGGNDSINHVSTPLKLINESGSKMRALNEATGSMKKNSSLTKVFETMVLSDAKEVYKGKKFANSSRRQKSTSRVKLNITSTATTPRDHEKNQISKGLNQPLRMINRQ